MDHEDLKLENRIVSTLKEARMIKSRPNWSIAAVGALAISAAAIVGLQSSWLHRGGSSDREYILALYSAPDNPGGSAQEYSAWARSHHTGKARVIGGDELAPAVATFGGSNPAGPQLVGFFRIAADNDADAVALARTTPHLRYGGSVSIRPTVG